MGVLTVKLLSASNLKRKDFLSKSDPFCELTLAGQTQRSRTVHNNQNPFWGDVFSFSVSNPLSESLVIHVYDKDYFTRNDSLGYCIIPLNTLMRGQPMSRTYQLLGASKGCLTVELTAQDFGGGMPMAATTVYTTTTYAPPPMAYGYVAPPPQPQPVYYPPAQTTYYPPPAQSVYYPPASQVAYAPTHVHQQQVQPQNIYTGLPPQEYGFAPPPLGGMPPPGPGYY